MAALPQNEIRPRLTMSEALDALSREERFMATVQAMNTLLIDKGIYSTEEFEALFIGWAERQADRPLTERLGFGR